MTLYDILCLSAEKMLKAQRKDGGFEPGHNGPYNSPETPVRNTAHWSITFLKVYEITDDERYLDAAVRCGEYLLSKEACPMNQVYHCRKNPYSDFANGLVGQAWAIEALVALHKKTKNDSFLEKAVRVFKIHPYDDTYKAWYRLNVDGSYNGFDRTFNHQLWFAASGGLLSNFDNDIKHNVLQYLDYVPIHLDLYSNGCIKHNGRFLVRSYEEKIKYNAILVRDLLKRKNSYLKMKSIGYQSFNIYALAMLKETFPMHYIWKSKKIKKTLQFTFSDYYRKEIYKSKYGFPYNPPGIELAYSLEVFNPKEKNKIDEWLRIQFDKNFDFKKNLMIKNTHDENTAAARIYEATRIKNDYTIKS